MRPDGAGNSGEVAAILARAPLTAASGAALLVPLPYFHMVFTLPAAVGAIAYQNKAVVYGLLFKAAAETTLTIAADPKHLGARIGFTAVLHTWGSALTHHPHVHMIVPGGGLSLDGERFVHCRHQRRRFFLPVRVLSQLFRRLFLEKLAAAYREKRLVLRGELARLAAPAAFAAELKPLRRKKWFVYAKEPFAGPKTVLAYLSRYTHRVAISNSRLIAHDEHGVTFRYKDYRIAGPDRQKVMTLATDEFIRRFMLHILPRGFHRIRHYGLFANTVRAANLARMRELLRVVEAPTEENASIAAAGTEEPVEETSASQLCPCCGGRMILIEVFERGAQPRYQAPPVALIRIDTS